MIMRASCADRRLKTPMSTSCNGDLAGPLAIMICKPRQARKGATVAVSYVPGCGWLGRLQHLLFSPLFFTPPISACTLACCCCLVLRWCLFPALIAIIAPCFFANSPFFE